MLKAVEEKRQQLEKSFEKTDSDYLKNLRQLLITGLEAAKKNLQQRLNLVMQKLKLKRIRELQL